ncbi:MAG: energy transducer TonB [Sphingobacteriaceae bacterium]|nr:energy transducer TonB [Sphingobacteriaceae bacterium]
MKNIAFLFALIHFWNMPCLAQKQQNVYFFKNSGEEVKLKENADYIRVIQEPDSGSRFFNLIEFYPNGSKKRVGKLSKFEPHLRFEEALIVYYEDGNRKEVTQYSKGVPKGLQFIYHPNGKLRESSVNVLLKNDPSKTGFIKKVISYYDSTGLAMIKSGIGTYKTFDNDAVVIEEGNYLDSLKHGVWKGTYRARKAYYEETFERGNFLKGAVTFENGNSYSYNKLEEMPEFKGGMEKFYRYVGENFRYPREAIDNGVSVNVMVHFAVEADGSLSNIKLERDPGYGIGKEALRVVNDSPKWIAGRQHGVPVKVAFILPFQLQIRDSTPRN